MDIRVHMSWLSHPPILTEAAKSSLFSLLPQKRWIAPNSQSHEETRNFLPIPPESQHLSLSGKRHNIPCTSVFSLAFANFIQGVLIH